MASLSAENLCIDDDQGDVVVRYLKIAAADEYVRDTGVLNALVRLYRIVDEGGLSLRGVRRRGNQWTIETTSPFLDIAEGIIGGVAVDGQW